MTKTEMKISNIEQVFDVKEAGRTIELYYDGKKVGEIKRGSLSRFPADYDGQIELMEYLLEMLAKHLGGTLLEFAECECEECDSVAYVPSMSDFLHIYGDERATAPDHELTADFDGRVVYATEWSLERFWSDTLQGVLADSIAEIDPKNRLSVYTYKGKDWYVGFQVECGWVEMLYWDDEYGEPTNSDEPYAIALLDMKAQENALEVLASFYANCEIEGLIERVAIEGADYPIEIPLAIKKVYDDNWELYDDILAHVKDEHDPVTAVENAIERLLENSIRDGKIFGRYKHLLMLYHLAEEYGCELRKTPLLNGELRHAIVCTRNGRTEEYHFLLRELLLMSPQKFFQNVMEQLEKRFAETQKAGLLEKEAARVFVSIEDSLESGNCRAGTMQFLRKHGIDPNRIGGIRGDVLLSMDSSSFVKRAVLHAIKGKKESA